MKNLAAILFHRLTTPEKPERAQGQKPAQSFAQALHASLGDARRDSRSAMTTVPSAETKLEIKESRAPISDHVSSAPANDASAAPAFSSRVRVPPAGLVTRVSTQPQVLGQDDSSRNDQGAGNSRRSQRGYTAAPSKQDVPSQPSQTQGQTTDRPVKSFPDQPQSKIRPSAAEPARNHGTRFETAKSEPASPPSAMPRKLAAADRAPANAQAPSSSTSASAGAEAFQPSGEKFAPTKTFERAPASPAQTTSRSTCQVEPESSGPVDLAPVDLAETATASAVQDTKRVPAEHIASAVTRPRPLVDTREAIEHSPTVQTEQASPQGMLASSPATSDLATSGSDTFAAASPESAPLPTLSDKPQTHQVPSPAKAERLSANEMSAHQQGPVDARPVATPSAADAPASERPLGSGERPQPQETKTSLPTIVASEASPLQASRGPSDLSAPTDEQACAISAPPVQEPLSPQVETHTRPRGVQHHQTAEQPSRVVHREISIPASVSRPETSSANTAVPAQANVKAPDSLATLSLGMTRETAPAPSLAPEAMPATLDPPAANETPAAVESLSLSLPTAGRGTAKPQITRPDTLPVEASADPKLDLPASLPVAPPATTVPVSQGHGSQSVDVSASTVPPKAKPEAAREVASPGFATQPPALAARDTAHVASRPVVLQEQNPSSHADLAAHAPQTSGKVSAPIAQTGATVQEKAPPAVVQPAHAQAKSEASWSEDIGVPQGATTSPQAEAPRVSGHAEALLPLTKDRPAAPSDTKTVPVESKAQAAQDGISPSASDKPLRPAAIDLRFEQPLSMPSEDVAELSPPASSESPTAEQHALPQSKPLPLSTDIQPVETAQQVLPKNKPVSIDLQPVQPAQTSSIDAESLPLSTEAKPVRPEQASSPATNALPIPSDTKPVQPAQPSLPGTQLPTSKDSTIDHSAQPRTVHAHPAPIAIETGRDAQTSAPAAKAPQGGEPSKTTDAPSNPVADASFVEPGPTTPVAEPPAAMAPLPPTPTPTAPASPSVPAGENAPQPTVHTAPVDRPASDHKTSRETRPVAHQGQHASPSGSHPTSRTDSAKVVPPTDASVDSQVDETADANSPKAEGETPHDALPMAPLAPPKADSAPFPAPATPTPVPPVAVTARAEQAPVPSTAPTPVTVTAAPAQTVPTVPTLPVADAHAPSLGPKVEDTRAQRPRKTSEDDSPTTPVATFTGLSHAPHAPQARPPVAPVQAIGDAQSAQTQAPATPSHQAAVPPAQGSDRPIDLSAQPAPVSTTPNDLSALAASASRTISQGPHVEGRHSRPSNRTSSMDRSGGEDDGLSMTVMPHAAHMAIESSEGDLALHLRVRHGNADVTVGGSMAPLFESRAPEARAALASEGLSLGRFDLGQQGGGQQGHAAPERPERASEPSTPYRHQNTPAEPTPGDGRIHVTA